MMSNTIAGEAGVASKIGVATKDNVVGSRGVARMASRSQTEGDLEPHVDEVCIRVTERCFGVLQTVDCSS